MSRTHHEILIDRILKAPLLFIGLLLGVCSVVNAQERDQIFTLKDAEGALIGEFPTQEEAEAAIKTIPGPSHQPDAYQYVDTLKESRADGSGLLVMTYWMGREKAVDEEWRYFDNESGNFETEAGIVADLTQRLTAEYAECGSTATLTPVTGWNSAYDYSEYDLGVELRWRRYKATYVEYDGVDCVEAWVERDINSMRRSECPIQYMNWHISTQACANKWILATITTTAPECDGASPSGMVGNPCDVKTGEKVQVEQDFDLGWLTLKRFYHSGAATVPSRLGTGWSISHEMSLGVNEEFITLVEGSGYVIRFLADPGKYVASNGSNEVIKAVGEHWELVRQDATYLFDQSGKLVRRTDDQGRSLDYGYDQWGRIESIASLQGRFVVFSYQDDNPQSLLQSVGTEGGLLVSYAYDQGRLTQASYPDGTTRVYHYEDARFPRHLTGVSDENGVRYSTFGYDGKGRAISTSHAGGADLVQLSYTANGTVVEMPLGGLYTYGFSAVAGGADRISSITNSEGSETFDYGAGSANPKRRLLGKTDRSGVLTTYAYASSVENGSAFETETVREAQGLPDERLVVTKAMEETGRVASVQVGSRLTSYAWNDRLQVTGITLSDTVSSVLRLTALSYCEQANLGVSADQCPYLGLLRTIDGPQPGTADRTTYAYYTADHSSCASNPAGCAYRKGDLWKVTNGLGQVTETLAYDGAGRPKSVKDPNGVITDYEYHVRGWLTAVKVRGTNNSAETDDRITRIEYWPTGLVKKVTLPMGAVTNYTYDAAHRLTQVSDNAGNKIVYTLDNAGNRIKEEIKNSGGTLKATLSRVYNQLGQLATAADASANPTDFSYDANGNTTGAEDALGRTTSYAFDALNRLKESIQDTAGIQAKTGMKYNALDQVTEVTDPKGLKTTYKYNGFGDLTELKSPDTGTTTYTYDEAGNVKTAKDARGKTSTYAYDGLNRVTSIGYASTALNVAYGYDTAGTACASGETFAKGRLSSMTDGAGTTQYCYNRFGDVVRKVQTINGVNLTLRYTYAANGNLTGMVYPDNTVVDYTRDVQGRVTAVGVTRPAASREVVLSQASYHPFGPVASWTYGNGRTMTRPVDLDYRPLAIVDSAADGLQVGFGYDPVGNLTSLNSATNTTPQLTIGYDALGRLTSLSDPNAAQPLETYTYDATGNRTSAKQNGLTKAYTYASTSHRLANVGGLARSYAAHGSTTALNGTVKQFTYDDTGRMQQAKNGSTVVMNYRYNGRGERTRAYLGSANTYTLYDEAGHWLGDYGNNGTLIQQAIWIDDLPVGVVTTAKIHYLQPDHLGTPRAVIDPASNKAIWSWSIRGEAFGATAPNEDPDQDGQTFVFNLRFPGQRYDAASGLNYNYFRDYEPATGRYVQSDPIGLHGGISTFSYASASPVNRQDPRGLEDFECWHVADGRTVFGCPSPPAPKLGMPDYIRVQASWYVLSTSRTFSRSGNSFVGGGVQRSYPVSSFIPQASISAGWLMRECPASGSEVDDFIGGFGMSGVHGYRGYGGGISWSPGQGTAAEVGLGMSAGVSPGEVAYPDGRSWIGGW